jgi:hypothetical protein
MTDLRDRLARVRWPQQPDGAGWDLGTNRGFLQRLTTHWPERNDCMNRLQKNDARW